MNAASAQVGIGGAETVPNPTYAEVISKAMDGIDLSALEEEEVGDLLGSETIEDETQESETETTIEGEKTGDEAEETSIASEDTARGKSTDKATETDSEKLPGIDAVLRELDEVSPPSAKVVRKLITSLGDNHVERKNLQLLQNQTLEMQTQLRKALDEIVSGNSSTEQDDDDDDDPNNPLSRVKPEERDLFRQALDVELRRRGIKTGDEQEAAEAAKSQAEYIKSRYKEHVDKFGESFGRVQDDGSVELSPGIKAKVEAVRDRLSSSKQGVTWADLHILAMHDEIVKAEVATAVEEFKKALMSKSGRKIGMLRRAETVSGTAPPSRSSRILPARGESQEAFRKRVVGLALAKLPSLQRE